MANKGSRSGPHAVRVQRNHVTKWVAECLCGYVSANRRTRDLAEEAATHHLKEILKANRRDGITTSTG